MGERLLKSTGTAPTKCSPGLTAMVQISLLMMEVMLPSSSMKVSKPKELSPRLERSQIQLLSITLSSNKLLESSERVSKLVFQTSGLKWPTTLLVFPKKQPLEFIDLTKCLLRVSFFLDASMLTTLLPSKHPLPDGLMRATDVMIA